VGNTLLKIIIGSPKGKGNVEDRYLVGLEICA